MKTTHRKKSTTTKAVRASRATPAPAAPPVPVEFHPIVRFEPIVLPLANGRHEIIPGKPIVTARESELTTAEFARLTGLSQRRVQALCDAGQIVYRRKSPLPKSEYLIPRIEVERYLQIK